MRRTSHQAWPIVLLLALFAPACEKVLITQAGRPCADERCAPGFACHPVDGLCVPEVRVGCDSAETVCPEAVSTGAPCASAGGFIPCASQYTGCEAGCRTCLPNGTWSECSCRVGQLISCRTCTDDCTATVSHALPACQWVGGAYLCGYEGGCDPGWVDRDQNSANGCECELTAGGVEICDNVDNDCDGSVDEQNPCAGAALCVDGTCIPCTSSDDDYCGPSCATCSGELPRCLAGTCGCAGTSCGAARWCDAGTCVTCANDDELHCGASCAVCPSTLPECVGGACVCNSSSCGTGFRCAPSGACVPCDETAYCGPTCDACPVGHPVCAPATGVCTCRAGNCPAGSYCLGGTCTACACPAMFPACTDQGNGTFRCNCTATSCPHGGACIEDDTTCQITDDFESGSLLTVCTGALNSTWARGTPNYGSFTSCASGSTCWGTNLTGPYANCELSCLDSPPLALAGIDGTVEISFAARYRLEYLFDGATVRFSDGTNWLRVDPVDGWDRDPVILGEGCTNYTYPAWPVWGQYAVDAVIGWQTKRFALDSATQVALFTDAFKWRLWFVTDPESTNPGFYIDDLAIRIHHRP